MVTRVIHNHSFLQLNNISAYFFCLCKISFPAFFKSMCRNRGSRTEALVELAKIWKDREANVFLSLLPDKMHEKCQDRYVLNDMEESIRMFSMYMLMYPIILKTFEIEAIVS